MKIKALIAAAVLLLPLAANAFEDTVEKVSRSFQLTYPNGQQETIVVEWTAVVSTEYQRHGSASTWKHPIDDRSCTWSSTASVVRQAYFVSAAGIRAPITESLQVFNSVQNDKRGPRNFIQAAGGYHTTCGDQMGKIQATHAATINSMKGAVQDVVDADAEDAEKNLMALLKPIKIQKFA